MKRIFLFLMTNLAVLALLYLVIFVIQEVFGLRLGGGGAANLLVFSAVFGFGGALISLGLSMNAIATGARPASVATVHASQT